MASATGAVAAFAALDWTQVTQAAAHAHAAASDPGPGLEFTTLAAGQAALVAAIAARIVPTDDTPGATEAGVVYFIDRGLGTFLSGWRDGLLKGLADFKARFAAAPPGVGQFGALPVERQDAFLTNVQDTRFFGRIRLMTLCGLLASPVYGGNRNSVGWKLVGFEEAHQFTPPFGYYDRDYPGFEPYPPAAT